MYSYGYGGVRSMASCSQEVMKENPEAVKPVAILITLPPTPAPALPIQLPPEDYPDYVDDEKSSDSIAKVC